jgi:L-lactate dehydrogenase complex protein LldG
VPAENTGRGRILQRIRTGLQTPSPALPASAFTGPILEPIADPLTRFQQECSANLMECILTADGAASAAALETALASLPEGELFVQDSPALRQLIAALLRQRPVRWSSEGAPRESSQATLTLAESLIAQTGSVFVTAGCGGRGATVVAPCHIVFATTSQLVPDLQTALGDAFRQGKLMRNSYASVISGSSRTADIEKILVQGAHGPRRLVVILQQSA